jgi:hypothetical protein
VTKKVTEIAQKATDAATPTDKLIKRVVVRIGGKDWSIVITNNVIIEAERSLDMNLMDQRKRANIFNPSFEITRELLYLALKHAGAEYTREELGGGLCHPLNLAATNDAIYLAWKASNPDPDPEDDAVETENPTQAAQ